MNAPRKLAAILAADVAGYSRLTGLDEEGTLKRPTIAKCRSSGLALHGGAKAGYQLQSVLRVRCI